MKCTLTGRWGVPILILIRAMAMALKLPQQSQAQCHQGV
jgi:hypothetical protein